MIIGTAGHIDHGKTRLVKVLTGVDTDSLKEERQRGITIDLGFAYWHQADGSRIGFVDVPGHQGYVRNMVAGVTGIEALLLVVAANEGIKPQTREHLSIAGLLGISRGVIALSKSDLADSRLVIQRTEELRALLADTPLSTAAIVPVSALTGEGLDHLRAEIVALACHQHQSESMGRDPFRMAIDRAFSMKGTGTIVTGSVKSGVLRPDDRVVLSPSGRALRVRGLRAQNSIAEKAGQGDRAAINLADCSADDMRRGDVLVSPFLHRPTQLVDVALRLAPGEKHPGFHGIPVHVHSGTGAWTGRLLLLSRDVQSLDGQILLARLKLDEAVAVWGRDRFVLRDASATRTIGGGTILDSHPPRRQHRTAARLNRLSLTARLGAVKALPAILAAEASGICVETFAADNGLDPQTVLEILSSHSLLHMRHARLGILFDPGIYLKLVRDLKRLLAKHHETQPDQAGMSASRLHLGLTDRLDKDAFAALLAHLIARGELSASGDIVRLPTHVARLSPDHEALWTVLRPFLAGEAHLKPPRVNELAERLNRREETIRGLLKRLARRGDVDEVASDHFLLRETITALGEVVEQTARSADGGWFNAAAFRDRIGIGRRMAILVLEYFDRQGLTIRKGDLRRIDPRYALGSGRPH